MSIKIPIQHFLPHREPMLMVDYIVAIEVDFVACEFEIKSDCVFVENDNLQEVGIIENMAQTCSSIVGQNYYTEDYDPEKDERIIGFISGIKEVVILSNPKVGELLFTKASLISKFEGEGYSICTMQVVSSVVNEIVARAEINLFLQANKS